MMEKSIDFSKKSLEEQEEIIRTKIATLDIKTFKPIFNEKMSFFHQMSPDNKYDHVAVWIEKFLKEQDYLLLAKFLTYFSICVLELSNITVFDLKKLIDVFPFGSINTRTSFDQSSEKYTLSFQFGKVWLGRHVSAFMEMVTDPKCQDIIIDIIDKIPFDYITVEDFITSLGRIRIRYNNYNQDHSKLTRALLNAASKRRFKSTFEQPLLNYLFLSQYYPQITPIKVDRPSFRPEFFNQMPENYRNACLEIMTLFKFEKDSMPFPKDIGQVFVGQFFQMYLDDLVEKLQLLTAEYQKYLKEITIDPEGDHKYSEVIQDLFIDYGYMDEFIGSWKNNLSLVVATKLGYVTLADKIKFYNTTSDMGFIINYTIRGILQKSLVIWEKGVDLSTKNRNKFYYELWKYCQDNDIKLSDVVRGRHPDCQTIINSVKMNLYNIPAKEEKENEEKR